MMKFYKTLFSSLFLSLVVSSSLFGQKPLALATGGDYNTAGNDVSLYSYHPKKDTVFLQDTIPGDFTNEVLYDADRYYLHVGRASGHPAGGDAIYVYDEYSFDVIDSIKPVKGTQEMAIKDDFLIVARGFGAGSDYVQIYDLTNLSVGPIYTDDTIQTSVNGLTVMGDSAYLGYTKNDTGHIATLDLSGNVPAFGSVHPMDTLSAGIQDLTHDSDHVYAVSERYTPSFTLMYAGITSFDTATTTYATDTNSNGSNSPVLARNDSLWLNVDTPMNVYEKASGNIDQFFAVDYNAGIYEASSDRFFFQRTDFVNMGDLLITDASGNRIDSFETDIAGHALGFIDSVRASVGPDRTLCASDSLIQVNGMSNTGNGSWISSGTGSFISPNKSNTYYDPSNGDTANGSVQLSYVTKDTGSFAPDTASFTATFISLPEVSTASDIDTTVNADSVNVNGMVSGAGTDWYWSSYGSGTFTDSTKLNTYYHPSAGDKGAGSVNLLLTATNNGDCPQDDVLNLNFNDTDLEEENEEDLSAKLHPIPASSELYVTIPRIGGANEADYELLDLTGRVLREGKLKLGQRYTLDVSGLRAGTFFLRVTTEEDELVRKWVKE